MSSTANLTWNASSGNTQYIVEYKKQSSSVWLTASGSPTTSTSLPLVLEEGTAYDFRVSAMCGSATSVVVLQSGVTVCKAPLSLTATPSVGSVTLSWASQPEHQTYSVAYKRQVDGSYTAAPGSPVVNVANPNTLTINGLTNGTLYDFSVTTNCVNAISSSSFTTATPITPIWIRSAYVCEQEATFTQAATVTGLSSPQGLYFDIPTDRFYVVDVDDVGGNLWRFNPSTFTASSGRDYIVGSQVPGQLVQAHDFDRDLRRIYMAGPSTNGLVVYDIAANTFTTVAYGANGSFPRLLVKILGNLVYCSNQGNNVGLGIVPNMTVIDKTSLSVISVTNITSIPSGSTYLSKSFNIYRVGNEIWVCASFSRGNGNIARYNLDFTSLIGTITVPYTAVIAAGWPAADAWQSQFHDEANGKFYVADVGSNKIFVIDTTTRTIVKTINTVNRLGKPFVIVSFSLNELTNELYLTYNCLINSADGSQKLRFYRIDRPTSDYQIMNVDQSVAGLKNRLGTNEFWSLDQGTVQWSGTPTWNTDGLAFKYIG